MAGVTWGLATLVAAGCAALPWAFEAPQLPSAVLDASYQVVLGQAASRGFVVGRDLIFTYGPLSWLLFSIQNPATYPAHVVGTVLLALLTASLYMALARRSGWPVWLAVAVFVPLVLALSLPERRVYGLAVLVVAYLHDRRSPTSPLLVAAATLVVGVLGLAKFTLLILGLALYGLLALGDLLRGRLEGSCWLLVLVIVWPLGWLTTYGSLAGFFDFLSTSAEVARAHGVGHQVSGLPREVLLVLALAVPSLLLASAAGATGWAYVTARLASFACLWAIVFKHAFLRHDVHALLAWSTLLAVDVVSLVAGTDVQALRMPGRGRVLGMLATRVALVAASIVGLLTWSDLPWRRPLANDVVATLHALPESARRAGRLATGDELARFAERWAGAMAELRAGTPLPPITGTVDLYGNDQALAFAHDLAWHPRPVFQSYIASTPRLLALNAEHVAHRGADTLLFALPVVDDRLPATSESTSWPILLSHYVADTAHDGLVILRRAPPGRIERVPLATIETRLGERVLVPSVPPGALVWVHMTIPPSPLGVAVRTLWKAPIVRLRPDVPGLQTKRFTVLPEMAAAGFVLSPFVADARDFATLAAALPNGPIPLPAMRSFRLTAARPREFGVVTIVFERLTIDPPGSRPVSAR